MTIDASVLDEFRRTLETRAERYAMALSRDQIGRLSDYYELLLTWNPRLHLTAPCSPAEFATRHILESLLLLPHLKPHASVADIGSGGGLPIIPALIARPDIQAVLIESSPRKAVFLREALRATATSQQAQAIAARFESTQAPDVDYVSCRALDRFDEMLPRLVEWSPVQSKLLLFGGRGLQDQIERAGLKFSALHIPDSKSRYLYLCR
jgi:16S rRNA (guanine(527)-N(7))-methyltransferase RsmG